MNIITDQCTNSANNNVVGEWRQIDKMRLALFTAEFRASNLPFQSPLTNEVWVMFTGSNHYNRKRVIGPTHRSHGTATRGCAVTIQMIWKPKIRKSNLKIKFGIWKFQKSERSDFFFCFYNFYLMVGLPKSLVVPTNRQETSAPSVKIVDHQKPPCRANDSGHRRHHGSHKETHEFPDHMVARIDNSRSSSVGHNQVWRLKSKNKFSASIWRIKLTYKIVFTTKEALPSDLEDGWFRPVSVLSVGFSVTINDGVGGVEIRLGLNVAVIDVPMIPCQHTPTPEIKFKMEPGRFENAITKRTQKPTLKSAGGINNLRHNRSLHTGSTGG